MTRGFVPDGTSATRAIALAQNARQMVLNRDPRFIDLAALVSQTVIDQRSTNASIAELATALSNVTTALAANSSADQATRDQLTQINTSITTVQGNLTAVDAEVDRLGEALQTATAQLAAADVELAARITKAQQDIENEATTRAAADAAEALIRANADAAEARARADADATNQAKQQAALAAETTARQAADTKEAADRAAADTALAARATALENYMPAVTSGRATRASLLLAAGATVDIPVTFDTPAPDTGYVPVVIIDAPNLAQWTIVNPMPTKTTTGVTVRLRTSTLISLATNIHVTVIALKL